MQICFIARNLANLLGFRTFSAFSNMFDSAFIGKPVVPNLATGHRCGLRTFAVQHFRGQCVQLVGARHGAHCARAECLRLATFSLKALPG